MLQTLLITPNIQHSGMQSSTKEELSYRSKTKRWFDLRRMYPDDNDFVTFMQSVEEPNVGNKYTGFKAYEILLPLPYDEVFLNKNLNQNDGY